ncbi:MAG: UDP-N-acetylmuramoyl-tripeptide--D-alanyl-D-alanine ligase [Bacteroidales bacterium]|nr:UDP-N-acetylmuramoyl-tripeptide--D-alanyl-D-alanine ligase [Bacteroidales bacterium]
MEIKDLYSLFRQCAGVTTDSRTIAGGEMFFALKGENFDGNEYALKALEQGARFAVVDAASAVASMSPVPQGIIPVGDTLETLQALANYHRENTFVDGKRLTVIGLTGTNGKTTTKELITAVLSSKFKVTATKGNLNNDIGVPLSLLSIGPETELAVIEMGASHPEDITGLVAVCDPDYGLITNVGKAHLLGFGSFEGVKYAKGKLYDWLASHGGTAFVNADDPILTGMASERAGMGVIRYGISYSGSIVLPSDAVHPFVRMAVPEEEGSETLLALESHLAGAYNAANIAAAIAVGMHFGISLEEAIAAVEAYVPTNNRSQMERSSRNILIKDLYNANPTSMEAALDNLALTDADSKVALLGEMRELGEESLQEHILILRKVRSMGLDLVCLVGEEFRKALEAEPEGNEKCFGTSEELSAWLGKNPVSGATVLVKGSRGVQMEKALKEL